MHGGWRIYEDDEVVAIKSVAILKTIIFPFQFFFFFFWYSYAPKFLKNN